MKKFHFRKKPYFIAEIGINHEGNLNLCKKMILEAKKSGADAAKVQIVNAEDSYDVDTPSYKEFKKRTLDFSSYKVLKNYAKKIKIDFFATAGDFQSLKIIKKLKFPIIKVSSGVMTNSFLLEECFKTGKFLIVSNGIGNSADHRFLKSLIRKYRYKNKICILKCTSQYPSLPDNLNLNSIPKLKKDFNTTIGYSDHTFGIDAVMAAICKGARVIEKHFTLDDKKKGADHKISLIPEKFRLMVKKSNLFLKMLGKEDYFMDNSLFQNRKNMLRYLVTTKKITKNKKIDLKKINFKRIKNSNGAIDSTVSNRKFLNLKLKKNVNEGQILRKNMFYD